MIELCNNRETDSLSLILNEIWNKCKNVLNILTKAEVDVLVTITSLKDESAFSNQANFGLYRSSVPAPLFLDFVMFDSSCLYTVFMVFNFL
jgi:hypothetical protein